MTGREAREAARRGLRAFARLSGVGSAGIFLDGPLRTLAADGRFSGRVGNFGVRRPDRHRHEPRRASVPPGKGGRSRPRCRVPERRRGSLLPDALVRGETAR